jgi:hypothetical protein
LPIHIDEEGNVIPEEITPENPGMYLKYTVPYPDTGDTMYYWFTTEQINSIAQQYINYTQQMKHKIYPK